MLWILRLREEAAFGNESEKVVSVLHVRAGGEYFDNASGVLDI